MSRRHFLLVTPYFPPSAVIGVKRALNLCRNLGRHGWEPIVLAAEPDSRVQAPELEALVPSSIVVSRRFDGPLGALRKRAAARRPGDPTGADIRTMRVRYEYITPFDRYLWSTPAAVVEGLRLIRQHRPEVIVVNADPWSGLLVGHLLHRLSGLPWIADCRDPWSLHEAKMSLRPPISRAAVRKSEAAFFDSAARVIINCDAALAAYRAAYRNRLLAERFVCIRNAFDETIFDSGSEARSDAFTLAYFGSFKPFVGSEEILRTFSAFVRSRRVTPREARLLVVGGPVSDAAVASHGLTGFVERRPRVPLTAALRILRAADALTFVVEPSTPLVIPGKLYDYLAARRPILALSDSPEVNGIIESTRTGLVVPYGNANDAADALASLHAREFVFRPDEREIARYSAIAQAERFAHVLAEVCGE
jgi:glycosyltransferase involved in cell wall biosynthesis